MSVANENRNKRLDLEKKGKKNRNEKPSTKSSRTKLIT